MDEEHELSYERGERAAYTQVLQNCCQWLGYPEDLKEFKWIAERERIIAALRSICEDHGDNDWPDNLDIPCIIEKHLRRYLQE